MKRAALAAILFVSSSFAAGAQERGLDQGLIDRCQSCHAPDSKGLTSSTPRLNGQLGPYILNRLRELTDLTRDSVQATTAMHDTAHMRDTQRVAVADYFSRQMPTPAQPRPGLSAAVGERVYLQGDPAKGLTACQSCHGVKAEGQGNVPRLAGQRREYLRNQLWNFNFAMRVHATMNTNATKLNSDQIDGLTAYLGAG